MPLCSDDIEWKQNIFLFRILNEWMKGIQVFMFHRANLTFSADDWSEWYGFSYLGATYSETHLDDACTAPVWVTFVKLYSEYWTYCYSDNP